MNWTSLIAPAVVAAAIASIVSVIGFLINRSTVRGMHAERLAFDREQAERRASAEIALAERKLSADIALAEKKLSLDRAFAAWKRKTELAEEVLADFYRAHRIIQEARQPGSFGDEGKSRPKLEGETEEEVPTLNAYFAHAERLNNKSDFFAQLHARRYRFMAFFGSEAAKPFFEIHRVHTEILVAVRMLLMRHRERDLGFTPQAVQQWKVTIGWNPAADPYPARLDAIVQAIEQTCRPVIQELAQ